MPVCIKSQSLWVGQTITGIILTATHQGWVKSFPEWVGEMITEMVGQTISEIPGQTITETVGQTYPKYSFKYMLAFWLDNFILEKS